VIICIAPINNIWSKWKTPNMVFPLHLILCSSHLPCLCHANQHLKYRVVKQLEPYMCIGISIPLNLDKLHCIIIDMPCMHSHDHADSFSIVVSVASVVVVALCFFSDRTIRGVVSNDKFFGCFSTILSGKLSHPLPTCRGTYYLFVFMLSLMLYASHVFRSFVRVTYPIHLFPQSKTIFPPPPVYYLLFIV
jgi:hypothetical protein